jgi:hypothetical protein
MLQTGGCHFDKWNVPSERNRSAYSAELNDCGQDTLSPQRKQANCLFFLKKKE